MKKTVVRAVRISKDIDDLLQKEANRRKISINNLITGMFVKYIEWDRYFDRFGLFAMLPSTLRSILAIADEEKFPKAGKEMADNHMKEFLAFRFKDVSVRTWGWATFLMIKYGGYGDFRWIPEADGKSQTGVYKSDIGEKWIKLMGHYITQMYSNFKVEPFP